MNILSRNMPNKQREIHAKVFYYTLILVAITLPFSLVLNSISIVLLTCNWLVEGGYVRKIKSIKHKSLFLIFILFYTLHLVGMIYTSNASEGLFDLEKKLSLLILPLVISTSHLNTVQLKNILKSFLCSALISSIICLVYAFHRNNYFETFYHINWLYFSYSDLTEIINIQPAYLSLYIAFSILLSFFFLIENYSHYNWIKKITFFSLILYLTVFLFLLASRIAIVAMVIILFTGIIYFFYKKNELYKGVLVLMLTGISLLAIMYQIPIVNERFMHILGIEHKNIWISQYGDGKVPEVRMIKWGCAWNIIKDNWIIGVGTGDIQDKLQIEYQNINFDIAFDSRFNAHNQYLQTWLGIGLIGLLSYLTCLIIPGLIAWRGKQYLYLSFIILFSICCFTESMLCRQNGIVFYAFFNSLFAFRKSS